jgi:hypothetical protein
MSSTPPCEVHFWSRENDQIVCLKCGRTRWSVVEPFVASLQFTLPPPAARSINVAA